MSETTDDASGLAADVTFAGLLALADDPQRSATARQVLRRLIGLEGSVGAVQLQSTAEAAKRLGLHPRTVERMCRAGKIEGAKKLGSQWRLPVDAEPEGYPREPRTMDAAEAAIRGRPNR